ncbi:hypothetical protein B0T16DRAFT_394887 [Cercophora newfieldiana]|uniref:Uncharacterized protein n=1 Tax=Cercophora newfieldiana TaxID=92897 RepID=A0AA40CHJ7_9PEZI|nr:hypothetical protein B0T16DRAFT_394887 [Cercophora newfieldiana]
MTRWTSYTEGSQSISPSPPGSKGEASDLSRRAATTCAGKYFGSFNIQPEFPQRVLIPRKFRWNFTTPELSDKRMKVALSGPTGSESHAHTPSLHFITNVLLRDDSPLSPTDHDRDLHDQFPASFRIDEKLHTPHSIPSFNPIDRELNPIRPHQRIRFLWLTGQPIPPRPLHHQLLLGRDIFVSKRIDLHHPIPRYLLNPDFWEEYGSRRHLRECAIGFLLSYVALITYESDFRLAAEKGLTPRQLSWSRWRSLFDPRAVGRGSWLFGTKSFEAKMLIELRRIRGPRQTSEVSINEK